MLGSVDSPGSSAPMGGQPQFRFTQPPSKVLHVRNLPWECTEEELLELCKPFGKVLHTKLNVGTNHNQAFVEFADMNQAIAMVSYYASSSEPAQVRGKAVYLQYSTRQEITSLAKSGGDSTSSNVLLVTIEGVESGDVSIDVLHLVFSAFGFVQKIATFEKSAGFQALVQYEDSDTASSARMALDGRSIPSYLLPEHVTNSSLRISFSAHNNLNVKFQSHRSRDYTNPYLPVAPSASDPAAGSLKKENESNVLLASIDNMQYAVTIDVLHTVFSAFGFVQKIAIFEKSAGFQALIQYPDVATATAAKDALEGHCIYDGGFCKLRLSYSRHTDLNVKANNERSRDYTKPDLPSVAPLPPPTLAPPGTQPSAAGPSQPAPATQAAPSLLGQPGAPSSAAGVLPSPSPQQAPAGAAPQPMPGQPGAWGPQSGHSGMQGAGPVGQAVGPQPMGTLPPPPSMSGQQPAWTGQQQPMQNQQQMPGQLQMNLPGPPAPGQAGAPQMFQNPGPPQPMMGGPGYGMGPPAESFLGPGQGFPMGQGPRPGPFHGPPPQGNFPPQPQGGFFGQGPPNQMVMMQPGGPRGFSGQPMMQGGPPLQGWNQGPGPVGGPPGRPSHPFSPPGPMLGHRQGGPGLDQNGLSGEGGPPGAGFPFSPSGGVPQQGPSGYGNPVPPGYNY